MKRRRKKRSLSAVIDQEELERLNQKSLEELSLTCAWCKRRVSEDEPVYGMSARTRVDVSELGGCFIPLVLSSGKVVHAFVVTEDSEAKREGWDLVFMTCDEVCAQQLKTALERDKKLFGPLFEQI